MNKIIRLNLFLTVMVGVLVFSNRTTASSNLIPVYYAHPDYPEWYCELPAGQMYDGIDLQRALEVNLSEDPGIIYIQYSINETIVVIWRKCPEGLYWNPALCYCDYPWNVYPYDPGFVY